MRFNGNMMGYTCMYQQGCAPVCANAKLVNSNYTGVYDRYFELLNGSCKPTKHHGGLTAPGEIWM